MGESYEHQGHTASAVADWAGLLNIPATRTEAACASSGAALRSGIYAVLSGLADIVIVGGVEKMTHRTTAEVTEYLAMASDYPFEQFHGITFPGLVRVDGDGAHARVRHHRTADGSGGGEEPLSRKPQPEGAHAEGNNARKRFNLACRCLAAKTLRLLTDNRRRKLHNPNKTRTGKEIHRPASPHHRHRASQRHHRLIRKKKPHLTLVGEAGGENRLRNGSGQARRR